MNIDGIYVLCVDRVLDQRIMTQMVLNLGAADTNGDAIMEESDTQVAVMSLYATLGRILEIPQDATACFSYAEVGLHPGVAVRLCSSGS